MSHEHALKDDVGFLKRLARSGQGEPAPLAWLLALFGLAYGFMFLVPFILWAFVIAGMATRDIVPFVARPVGLVCNLIFAAGLVKALSQIWMTRRSRPRVNAVALTAWLGSLLALATVCASFVLIVVFHQRFYKFGAGTALALTTATPIVILALYGLAWWFAAAATGRHWLFAVAVGSFASALLMASTPPMMVLIGAISLLLLAFVPGLILAFAARRKAASP